MSPLSIPNYDSTTFQIPNTRLFIAGDVNADRAILHEAADEGRIAGYNAVRDSSQCFKRRQALAITFCDPNIAVIGKSFQQLKNENTDFITGKVSFEGQGRAIVMRKEKGLLHVFADRSTDQLLGAEMMAPSGEHLAHLLAWAIELNLRVDEVLSLPFYHPVVEEGLRTALRDAAKQVSTPPRPLEVLRCEDPPAGSLL